MNKVLTIQLWQEAYYEPSVDISFKNENGQKFLEYDMFGATDFNIRNCKDFFEAYKYIVLELEDYFDVKASTLYGLETMFKECGENEFKNIYENYDYLEKLKDRSYTYNKSKKLLKQVYNEEDGYGVFRQQIVPFGNIELLLKNKDDFKKYCFERLSEDLIKIASYENEDVAIKKIVENITYQEKLLKKSESDVKKYKKNILKQKKILKEIGDE